MRINGRDWSELGDPGAREACAPLLAVDGRAVGVRLPPTPTTSSRAASSSWKDASRFGWVQAGIASRPCLGSLGRCLPPAWCRWARSVRLAGVTVSRASPGRWSSSIAPRPALRLEVDAPEGALLMGGMPWHEGWVADGGELRRFPVPLDTFAAWTVEAPTAGPVTLRFQPQRIYELAIALSIAAAAWCLWRVTRRRRREPR